jgi:hypothetical protein
VGGLGVGCDGDEAADLVGAVVEQGQDLASPPLAAEPGVQRVHERGDGEPYPAEELFEFGDACGRVGGRVATEAGGGLGGAGVDAAQGAPDPGIGDGVGGDGQHEQHRQHGAERPHARLREPQRQQPGTEDAEEPVEQLGEQGHPEHHECCGAAVLAGQEAVDREGVSKESASACCAPMAGVVATPIALEGRCAMGDIAKACHMSTSPSQPLTVRLRCGGTPPRQPAPTPSFLA